ncbi:unnamed protein product [Fraxinus pennsylvanica]|uniref:Uncharacterized protein n=1 Tax=Fraxinus pennsylvanica TaxID=56036 RepID=A0AAD2E2P9_9LAMI|nr:unnamed protein product [Fraxinus pennsylvanica]
MDTSRPCKSCRKRTLLPDDVTGNMVCASCGVVQDFDNFQAHIGGITGPAGTYVRVGTAGTGSAYNYKESKIYEAQKLIGDFMFKLGLSASKSDEVKVMVETITTGEYGQGKWFPVFVGACAYVVMRKNKKILPIEEVADLVGCDVYELGRMINRVVDFLDLKLPEFDIVNSLEHVIRNYPMFNEILEDVVQRMLKQGVFLMQCLIKWFLTTGRRPMAVVAAVLVFVGELNQLDLKIEDVAKELHVSVITCRRRYKELLERLVKVARALPWGEDVTMKNIVNNAPNVIQYMEMKSMSQFGQKGKSFEQVGFDLMEVVGDCVSKETRYGFDSYTTENCSVQYFEANHKSPLRIEHPDKFQISPECLTMIYSKFLDEVPLLKATSERSKGNKRKRARSFDLHACTDWWKGKSDLSKKLLLKQVFEKDVGLDASPPSFDRGCLASARRREKIKTSKLRIQKIMHPLVADSSDGNDICVFKRIKSGKKQRKMQVDIDWEDLIIETLLLHNVKEEEIEKGHYNVLLDLHVFDYGNL